MQSNQTDNDNNPQYEDDRKEFQLKRENFAVDIRQKDREQNFAKRRQKDIPQENIDSININILSGADQSQTSTNVIQGLKMARTLVNCSAEIKESVESAQKSSFGIEHLPMVVEYIKSNDIAKQHYGTTALRKILSVDSPPIQPVIDANLVPSLLEFMNQDQYYHLQLEAAWALTNVASGTTIQTQSIVDKGGITSFVRLLHSQFPEVAEQAIWAIGNISGDSSIYRDMILRANGMAPLINIVMNSKNKNTIKHGSWALSNLCRGRPLPNFKYTSPAIPVFCKVVKDETDAEVLTDAAWALSYLSDGDDKRIQLVLDTQVLPHLIKLLDHPFLSILIPIVRTIGNIATGNDEQTNAVCSQPFALEKLFNLLDHDKKALRREVCWCLSNITAGNSVQINSVIQHEKFVKKILYICSSDTVEIVREAAWVISNATNKAFPNDVYKLLEWGVLEEFLKLLDSDDHKTVAVVLEAIKNILRCGQENFVQNGENLFLVKFDQIGGQVKIEQLQQHPNDAVYKKSLYILETYYECENPI